MKDNDAAKAAASSAWDALQKLGIERNDDGKLVVPPEALARIRSERARRLAISGVPSTPRNLQRDAGGLGVAKQQDRSKSFTLEGLRRIRDRSPLIQPIHAARAYQVRQLARKWDGKKTSVGWRVVHRDFAEPGKTTPPEIKPFADRFERMLTSPAPGYDVNTTGTLMGLLMEDLLTINRPCVELLHSMLDPKRVVQFRPVDGTLVWPTLVWLEKWKVENPGWRRGFNDVTDRDALELASAAIQYDVTGSDYVIVRDGLLEAAADRNAMIVAPIQNRTSIETVGYWPSHVEQAMDLITAFIRAFDFNTFRFTRGFMSEFAIALMGDIHDDDADAFIDSLREAAQGVENAWQPPIIQLPTEGSVTTIPFKDQSTDVGFEVWMVITAALTAGIYRMDMSTINAKPWDGGSGPSLSEGSREHEIQLAKEEGLQGDVQHLTDEILTPLARRCHPDLIVVWEYGATDLAKEAQFYDVRTNIDMSPNDVLVRENRPPRGFYLTDDQYAKLDAEDARRKKHDDNPWNWPRQGPVSAMAQQKAQSDQQAAMFAQQGGQPPQADEDGHGGAADEDNGFGQPAVPKPFGGPPGAPPGGKPTGSKPTPATPMTKARFTVRVYDVE